MQTFKPTGGHIKIVNTMLQTPFDEGPKYKTTAKDFINRLEDVKVERI